MEGIVEYIVPAAILNVWSNLLEQLPPTDDTYPIPDLWLEANASRYYFTDSQIIDTAKSEFDSSTAHRRAACKGIYFLIQNKEIVYVGMSVDMDLRIEQHRKNLVKFDSLTWFEAPKFYLKLIEGYYIRRIRPRLNVDIPVDTFFDEVVSKISDFQPA